MFGIFTDVNLTTKLCFLKNFCKVRKYISLATEFLAILEF